MTYGYHKHSVGVVTVDPSKCIAQSYLTAKSVVAGVK